MSIRFLLAFAVIALASPVFAQEHDHGHGCSHGGLNSSVYDGHHADGLQNTHYDSHADSHYGHQRHARRHYGGHAYVSKNAYGYSPQYAPLPEAQFRGGYLRASGHNGFQNGESGPDVGFASRPPRYPCPFHRGRRDGPRPETYVQGEQRGPRTLGSMQPFGYHGQDAGRADDYGHLNEHGHSDGGGRQHAHGDGHAHGQTFEQSSGPRGGQGFFPQAGPPPMIENSQAGSNVLAPPASDFQPMARPELPNFSKFGSQVPQL